jgi:hypothetical protein
VVENDDGFVDPDEFLYGWRELSRGLGVGVRSGSRNRQGQDGHEERAPQEAMRRSMCARECPSRRENAPREIDSDERHAALH